MQYKILKEPMAMLEIQLNNEEQLTADFVDYLGIEKTSDSDYDT